MGIGDWGLGNGDWGLGPMRYPQTAFANPPSQFKKKIFINKMSNLNYQELIKDKYNSSFNKVINIILL